MARTCGPGSSSQKNGLRSLSGSARQVRTRRSIWESLAASGPAAAVWVITIVAPTSTVMSLGTPIMGLPLLRAVPLAGSPLSDLRQATVHEQIDAGNAAALVRGQEDHRLRDLVGRACSTERRGRGGFRLDLRDLLVAQAGVLVPGRDDRAWAHDVDTNLAALQIDRPGARERPQGRLGRGVDAKGRYALHGHHGAVHHDRRAVGHQRQRLLYGEERAFDVDAERLVEVGLGDLAERHEFAQAGVGEEDVDATLLLLHRRVQSIQIREIGDVPLDAADVLADLAHRRVELGLTAPGDEDVRAFRGEPSCGGEADSAVAPGDDGDLAFELCHGIVLLFPVLYRVV